MISAPSNFNHISHMGPGDGIQIQRLMDLPTTLETADSTPPPSAAMTAAITNPQRSAKAMFTTPPLGGANKLVPGSRLPQHPGPPQRSISHNEVSFRDFCFRIFCLLFRVLSLNCYFSYFFENWNSQFLLKWFLKLLVCQFTFYLFYLWKLFNTSGQKSFVTTIEFLFAKLVFVLLLFSFLFR